MQAGPLNGGRKRIRTAWVYPKPHLHTLRDARSAMRVTTDCLHLAEGKVRAMQAMESLWFPVGRLICPILVIKSPSGINISSDYKYHQQDLPQCFYFLQDTSLQSATIQPPTAPSISWTLSLYLQS